MSDGTGQAEQTLAPALLSGRRAQYVVRLEGFEGPLALLLHLIERRELDVTTISLALVADQYLACVRAAEDIDPEALVEFIVVGAKLLLIKSAALLPAPERPEQMQRDEIEDPTDLTDRLRQYEAYRRAATGLRTREEDDRRSFARTVRPPVPPTSLAPGGHEPVDLAAAMRRVLTRALKTIPEQPIPRTEVSVPDRMRYLREHLAAAVTASLFDLLNGQSRPMIVATFLAILELLRLGEIKAEQDERFADVRIRVAGETGMDSDGA